ncbi:MAG: hypothetical protein WAQ74_01305 [Kiritimatiellia bacterium]|jgi:hypothetical protein|nr:hypothetical protein [Lentisphaerota bacterium]
MKKWILIAALVTLGALSASAGWKVVAEVTAGGDAKELAVNRTIRTVQIECTDGTVVVNTVVIREGAAKEPITVARRFNKGDKQDLDLGRSRNVTGLRISDSGKGRYKVHAK